MMMTMMRNLLKFDSQIAACAEALKHAKTLRQKQFVFEKFMREKESKNVSFLGNTYCWRNNMENKKFNYPACAELPKNPDISLMRDFLELHKEKWGSPYEQMPGLCLSEGDLAKQTYGQAEHICLTGPKEAFNVEDSQEYCEANHHKFSPRDKIRGKMDPIMDEYNWRHPLDFYDNSKLKEHLEGLFEAPIIRVKYSRLLPGKQIPPHIDYNTTYAIRFIIPLSGTKNVINRFWYKGEVLDYNLEPGKIYFLNIGYRHQVIHNGDEPREIILGSLGGQQDIECIKL